MLLVLPRGYYRDSSSMWSRFASSLRSLSPLCEYPYLLTRATSDVNASTYWMAGLANDAAHFFKFLFILVLYTLAMTLFVGALLIRHQLSPY